jgi:hypothetical protein
MQTGLDAVTQHHVDEMIDALCAVEGGVRSPPR